MMLTRQTSVLASSTARSETTDHLFFGINCLNPKAQHPNLDGYTQSVPNCAIRPLKSEVIYSSHAVSHRQFGIKLQGSLPLCLWLTGISRWITSSTIPVATIDVISCYWLGRQRFTSYRLNRTLAYTAILIETQTWSSEGWDWLSRTKSHHFEVKIRLELVRSYSSGFL